MNFYGIKVYSTSPAMTEYTIPWKEGLQCRIVRLQTPVSQLTTRPRGRFLAKPNLHSRGKQRKRCLIGPTSGCQYRHLLWLTPSLCRLISMCPSSPIKFTIRKGYSGLCLLGRTLGKRCPSKCAGRMTGERGAWIPEPMSEARNSAISKWIHINKPFIERCTHRDRLLSGLNNSRLIVLMWPFSFYF